MRRNNISLTILSATLILFSLFYLFLPSDPVSSLFQRVVFSLDNRLSGHPTGSINTSDTNELQSLRADNERLRNELGFKVYDNFETLPAQIVGKSVQSYRSSIDINVGSENGVAVGMPVLAQGQLIGRVVEVFSQRARILTYNDPDFRVASVIEGTKLSGLVRHVAGGTIIEQVPTSSDIDINKRRVITSGLGEVFPPGLLLGVIGDEVSSKNEIFKEYVLRSTIDIGSIQEVIVILR